MVEPFRAQLTVWSGADMTDDLGKDRHTLIMFNTYYFSTATVVTRTRLRVTLYVLRLSCFFFQTSVTTCSHVYALTKQQLSDLAPVVQGGGVSLWLTGQTINIFTSHVYPTLSHKRTCIHTFAMSELWSVNGAVGQGSIPSLSYLSFNHPFCEDGREFSVSGSHV